MKVFDGRLRFDLVLTPKRADRLPGEAPAGPLRTRRSLYCDVRADRRLQA